MAISKKLTAELKKNLNKFNSYKKLLDIRNKMILLKEQHDLSSLKGIQKNYRRIVNNKPEQMLIHRDPNKLRVGEIEINKNCNLNCVMCNTQLSKRKNHNMDLDLFENIILEMKRLGHFSSTVVLHTIGEPLINPLLEEYFKILKKHKFYCFLSTNGQILDKKLDLICKYSDVIKKLRFSVDGATKETYEKIRVPGKFDKLVDNLKYFKKVNGDGKYIKSVGMNSVVCEYVLKELAYHVKFYSQFVPIQNISLSLLNGLSLDNTFFLQNSVLVKHIVPNIPCEQLNDIIHILNDGTVTACCRDYNGDLVIGDILKDKMDKLVNSEKAVLLRTYHKDKQIPENHLCASCYQLDTRVNNLFNLFFKVLMLKNKDNWDVEKTQSKFEEFFKIFENKIPQETEYCQLFE